MIARLREQGGAIDRAARLLLEDADSDEDSHSADGGLSGPGEGDLENSLETLRRRWKKHRQTDLMRQIRQAQQQGDNQRLSQLLEEKKSLNRSLHPGMQGRFW